MNRATPVKPLIYHSHVDSGPLQRVRAHEPRRTSPNDEDIDIAVFRERNWHVASTDRREESPSVGEYVDTGGQEHSLISSSPCEGVICSTPKGSLVKSSMPTVMRQERKELSSVGRFLGRCDACRLA